MLTKDDITAFRKADDLCVHLDKSGPCVRLIKRKAYDAKPFETDIEYLVTSAGVEMYGYRNKDALANGARCFAMVRFYHDQFTPESATVKTLKAGDEIIFEFHPDRHTNGYVAAAGLHADCMMLRVRRDGKTVANWELETTICPDNTARMCRGVPDSESYAKDAESGREIMRGIDLTSAYA